MKRKCMRTLSLFLAMVMLIGLLTVSASAAVSTSKTYYIVSALDEKKVVDVAGGSRDSETPLQLYELNETGAQQFRFTLKNGYYTITNVNSGKVVDIKGGGTASGTRVQQYTANGTDAQKWSLIDLGNGFFSLRSKSGLYLDVKGGETANGTPLQIYTGNSTKSQMFKLVPLEAMDPVITAPSSVSVAPGSSTTISIRYSGFPVKHFTGSYNGDGLNVGYANYSLKAYPEESTVTFNVSASSTFKGGNLTIKLLGDGMQTIKSQQIKIVAAALTSKTLNVNWSLIQKTGKQSVSGPCFTFSLAYARDILDNKVHYWSEYDVYGGSRSQSGAYADRTLANFNSRFEDDKATALKDIYERVKAGKPVVINVNGGRSSGEHYVCVVGYTDVTNPSKLTEANFLIIDSAGGPSNKAENLGSLGYKLKWNSGQGYYYCFPR